jgi:hypothetical protein
MKQRSLFLRVNLGLASVLIALVTVLAVPQGQVSAFVGPVLGATNLTFVEGSSCGWVGFWQGDWRCSGNRPLGSYQLRVNGYDMNGRAISSYRSASTISTSVNVGSFDLRRGITVRFSSYYQGNHINVTNYLQNGSNYGSLNITLVTVIVTGFTIHKILFPWELGNFTRPRWS